MPKIRYRLANREEIDLLPHTAKYLEPVFVGTHYNTIVVYGGLVLKPLALYAVDPRYDNLGIEDDLLAFIARVTS